MKQLFLFFLSTCFLFMSCRQSPKVNIKEGIEFEEYFPLKSGNKQVYYVYHLKGSDTLSDKNDTLVCLSNLINKKEIFFLTDEPNDSNSIIGPKAFCDGVFYFDKGVLFLSPIFWRKDLQQANLDYFEPIFPKKITLDSTYRYQSGEEKRKYIFKSFEDISVKGSKIPSCLKLIILQDWPTAHYEDIVWFQKNVGVVKWQRSTGRLEEIKL